MIAKNASELGRILSEQARASGFVKSAIIVLLDFDDVMHKSEFGFNQNVVAPIITAEQPPPPPVYEMHIDKAIPATTTVVNVEGKPVT